ARAGPRPAQRAPRLGGCREPQAARARAVSARACARCAEGHRTEACAGQGRGDHGGHGVRRLLPIALLPLLVGTAQAQPPVAPSAPPSAGVNAGTGAGANAGDAPAAADQLFAGALRAYHAALLSRRLGLEELRRDVVGTRVAEAEQLMATGRIDEAIARLAELVEHPQFELFADSEEGRAAVFRLGDALATAALYEPARVYLRRVLATKGSWDGGGTWARRAVRRLVDMALESQEFAPIARDLDSVPASAPEEVRGEIAYMNGRAQEAVGSPDGALGAYATVTQRCRFWAQATYLSGLIQVEMGNAKAGETLLCKVADPKRSAATTPFFADEKFFAVRDLARLGLGRIAHEQSRNDDASYYYYLVPKDSDRLAEALYEAATTRYEKKDYEGARELLDELGALGIHHRYEDEAWVLSAWIDLARCKFPEADRQLVEFLRRYEPVRDAARRIGDSDAAPARGGPFGQRRRRGRDRWHEPGGGAHDRRPRARRLGLRPGAPPARGA